MHRLFGLILSILIAISATTASAETISAQPAGAGVYSDGYRMGMLVKCSVKGLFVKSTECELSLGKDGGPWQKGSSDDQRLMNPWAFSADKTSFDKLEPYEGRYVWIHYNQAGTASLARDTDYTVMDIEPVAKKTSPADCSSPSSKYGSYSAGTRVGRIVKLSFKGNLAKTFEAIIQVGNSGSNYIEMSITDTGIAECAKAWLQSGKLVSVAYTQAAFNVRLADTDYTIWQLAATDEL